jgi:hypothetical protein
MTASSLIGMVETCTGAPALTDPSSVFGGTRIRSWLLCRHFVYKFLAFVRFQVLTAASMMFRIVFWDVLPCKMIVDLILHQYIPEDSSELPSIHTCLASLVALTSGLKGILYGGCIMCLFHRDGNNVTDTNHCGKKNWDCVLLLSQRLFSL